MASSSAADATAPASTPTPRSPLEHSVDAQPPSSEKALIARAVNFLTADSVRQQPPEAKRSFLLSKGLTPQQIDEAVKEAAMMAPPIRPKQALVGTREAADPPGAAATPGASSRSSWPLIARGWLLGSVLGGALALYLWERRSHGRKSGDQAPATPLVLNLRRTSVADEARTSDACRPPSMMMPTTASAALSDLEQLRADGRRRLSSSHKATNEGAGEAQLSAEQQLAYFRACIAEMRDAAGATAGEGLTSLLVCLNAQLKHPDDKRYHRLNMQNANLQRLLAIPGGREALHALGFAQEGAAAPGGGGGSSSSSSSSSDNRNSTSTTSGGRSHYLVWRGGRLPSREDLDVILIHRDALIKLQQEMPG